LLTAAYMTLSAPNAAPKAHRATSVTVKVEG
jgi:hypothetical protein